jgi:hypothetical protein
MNLRATDKGKEFAAPSGRRVKYIGERGGSYFFVYVDDTSDGLALTSGGLRILDKPNDSGQGNSCLTTFRTVPGKLS